MGRISPTPALSTSGGRRHDLRHHRTRRAALVLVGCGALMPPYGAVEAGSRAGRRLVQWRASRKAVKATRKPRQPIPFVERPIPHRERWPLVTVLDSALVVAIWAHCGGVR